MLLRMLAGWGPAAVARADRTRLALVVDVFDVQSKKVDAPSYQKALMVLEEERNP